MLWIHRLGVPAISTIAGVLALGWAGVAPSLHVLLSLLAVAAWAHGGLVPGLVATASAALTTSLVTGVLTGGASPDAVGQLVGLVVLGVAISELGRRVVVLRQQTTRVTRRATSSERQLAESFHSSLIPLVLTRPDSHDVTEVNDAFLQLMGRERHELIGKTLPQIGLLSPTEQARLARRFRRSGVIRNQELVAQCRGELRDVAVSIDPMQLAGEELVLTTVIDHTEHRRTAAALSKTDEQFRELVEAIGEVFWMTDLERTEVLYVSPAYEVIFGRPRELLYRRPDEWWDAIHPDDLGQLRNLPHSPEELHGKVDEYRIVRPDREQRRVRNRTFVVRDREGRPVRLAGIASDVTVQRSLEEQVRQSQKMDSLGMLAGGVAHDFNNVLVVIASCNSLLAEELALDSSQRELVDDIDGAVKRATALTHQLLAFSRKQTLAPIALDLNATINETKRMLQRLVGVDVTVAVSLEPEVAAVRFDPGALVQVLMNLAVNARDAMEHRGLLRISTHNQGDSVVLTVTDDGCGMPPEIRTRIFEPFFTTKPVGRGTGMGLSVVHGVIDQAGGRIEVESAVGHGTTFSVYLPAIRAQVPRADTDQVARLAGAETILLVDDDVFVRRAAARALRSNGYTVVEAPDGDTALVQLGRAHAGIDLLLTDVEMPALDGISLVRQARTRRPSLRVLYTTGCTDDEISRRGVERKDLDLIEKPFHPASLVRAVRQVLDRPRQRTRCSAHPPRTLSR